MVFGGVAGSPVQPPKRIPQTIPTESQHLTPLKSTCRQRHSLGHAPIAPETPHPPGFTEAPLRGAFFVVVVFVCIHVLLLLCVCSFGLGGVFGGVIGAHPTRAGRGTHLPEHRMRDLLRSPWGVELGPARKSPHVHSFEFNGHRALRQCFSVLFSCF